MSSTALPPSAKQLRYLRTLAARVGQSFATPRTRQQASVEIRRLKVIRSTGFSFAELQAEEAAREARYDAPVITPFEVAGYGAECTWSRRS